MKQIPSLLIAFILGITVTAILSWKNNNNKNREKRVAGYDAPCADVRQLIAIRKLKSNPVFQPNHLKNLLPKN
jgi:hypothetical protein